MSPFIIQSFGKSGNILRPFEACSRARFCSFSCHSSLADFINTRAVGALWQALARSLRALSYSLLSDSNLTAASQISSELALAPKASAKMLRAPVTSPAIHFDLAPISHKISAFGQCCTAF